MSAAFDLKNPWRILFQFRGSIWCAVLPYCVLNCLIVLLVAHLKEKDVRIAFSPQGHALMTLIISYLVVSKVNLAFDRYMQARKALGHGLLCLRELNQLSITLTELDVSENGKSWRMKTKMKITELLNSVITVLKDEDHAIQLTTPSIKDTTVEDPLKHVQSLRSHLYQATRVIEPNLQLLERCKLIDLLHEFVNQYECLLRLASTPMPFDLVQMGRTFLVVWTFSMPFALVGVIDEVRSACEFVFFLTYGFLGLEFISMKLLHPFGNVTKRFNLEELAEATVIGIEQDSNWLQNESALASSKLFGKLEIEMRKKGFNKDDVESSYYSFDDG